MVVTILMIAAAVAVLAGIAVVSTGYGGELAPADPTRPGLELPTDRTLAPGDLERVRFTTGFWGYPPAQVEEVMDHAVRALAERDAHIADLEHRLLARQVSNSEGAAYNDVADDDVAGPGADTSTGSGEDAW